MKIKRLQVLEDTVKYYSEDVNRRCLNDYNCFYSPKSVGKEGVSEGCAVGRLLTQELRDFLDRKYTFEDLQSSVNKLFHHLPEDIKALGVSFLTHLQRLHDNQSYWDSTGLTLLGEKYVKSMRENIILGGVYG